MSKGTDWSQRLPKSIELHGLMTLHTFADVRTMMLDLPPETHKIPSWQHMAATLLKAADGQSTPVDVFVALWLVLQSEPTLRYRISE
jgi:hypothetical protein